MSGSSAVGTGLCVVSWRRDLPVTLTYPPHPFELDDLIKANPTLLKWKIARQLTTDLENRRVRIVSPAQRFQPATYSSLENVADRMKEKNSSKR